MKKYVLVIVGFYAVLGVVLYFLHPLGPLFLLLSLLIQAPLVFVISRVNYNSAYLERAAQRREEYAQTGDARVWLEGEEKEARSIGFKYWSSKGRALNTLNRAAALAALGENQQCAALLVSIETAKLSKQAALEYQRLQQQLQVKQ